MSFIERQQAPIIILDANRCKRNINWMAERAKAAGCEFRPHFKTHQSKQIGQWFRDVGVSGITVSSVSMAAYFIEDGWDDITIAFPFFAQQLSGLREIEKKASLRLFINSVEELKLLNKELTNPFKFFVEIDPGAGRSGISYQNTALMSQLIEASNKLEKSTFHGFYIHDGRTYRSRSKREIQDKINPTINILVDLKSKFPEAAISMGDTPSASTSDRLAELDELTPGNFVFYDYMQLQIGSCSLDDVALFAVLPIAQKIPGATKRTILHGGAVHLSKEFLPAGSEKNFGQIIKYSTNTNISETEQFISAVSQEHGTVQGTLSDNHAWVCPIHSCLTANLHSQYFTTDGKIIEKRILS